MKQFLHKNLRYGKTFLLAACLVLVAWFAFAGGFTHNPFDYQVKLVKCYPNPATSLINFDFSSVTDKNYTLQVYSFTGKKMADESINSAKITITLDNSFYRGIYIYHIKDKAGKIIESGKFQVVK